MTGIYIATGTALGLEEYHLFMVYENGSGERFVLRGGPEFTKSQSSLIGSWPLGNLKLEIDFPIESSLDNFSPGQEADHDFTQLSLGGQSAETVWGNLTSFASSMGGTYVTDSDGGVRLVTNIDYETFSVNCNSFMASALSSVGLNIVSQMPKQGGTGDRLDPASFPGLNTVFGGAGADTLTGSAVDNLMYGYGGNDTLNGAAGADTMYGGDGDDIYMVEDPDDVVVENADEGVDLVKSYVDYTLGANVENLTLMGSANIDGTGNGLDNIIAGNSGDNALDGGAGVDTVSYAGSTPFMGALINLNTGAASGDGIGNDTLSNFENVIGSNFDDTITGNDGDNRLAGGGGNDTLSGDDGADTFVLSVGDGNDTITDFNYSEGDDLDMGVIPVTGAKSGGRAVGAYFPIFS